ncbi:MAG: carbohydrate porin [Rhodopila sp.]
MTTGNRPDPSRRPLRSGWHHGRPAALVLALMVSMPAVAHGQAVATPPATAGAAPAGAAPAGAAPAGAASAGAAPAELGFLTNIWSRDTLLGNLGGLRDRLAEYGITIGLQETSEVLGNVTGGVHTGFAYDGATLMKLNVDTEKAFGLPGGTFFISALQIHGRNLAADNLLALQIPSNIEADRSTRLWELWYQQAFLDGRVDVKIGQQAADQEFITSLGASLFINSAMGWPVLPAVDLYAGGPAYPLSTLGARVRATGLGPFTVLAGVFDDNPPGGPFDDDSQVRGRERAGAQFNLNTGALFIAEVQYAINQPAGDADSGAKATGLPGTYKFGGWYDTGSFPDQRYDSNGNLLAVTGGDPLMRRHNYSLYAIADQAIWRPDPASPRTIGVFARVMGAPGDRNLVSFGANAGITVKAPLPGRDDDTFGVGWGIAKIGGNAIQFGRDLNALGTYTPVRSSENFIEVTYQCQVAPWWQVQPDFQYIFMPGGGIANPQNPSKRVGNEAILGVRTNITF